MTSRRDFLQVTAAGALGLGLGRLGPLAPRSAPLRILFLGGTGFIGPHQVRYAQSRGHQVTLFNRGHTAPDLFPGVETLIGDRDGKLDALKGRTWDAVIDNSGYVPRVVRDSAQLLAGNVGQYLFVSTAGVYQAFYDGSWPAGGVDESSPLAPLTEPGSEEVGKYYGPLKALCEAEVRKAFPTGATVLRPGLIVGPGDPTDRFTYWVVRPAKGGEMVAPGTPKDPILYIDARDLGAFSVHLVEAKTTGTFNLFGPKGTLMMGTLLDTCLAATGRKAKLIWVDGNTLTEHGVEPVGGLFPWVAADGPAAGASHFHRERAFRAGLTFMPVTTTVRDTLTWFRTLPAERQAKLRGGLPPEKEQEILAAWHARK